MREIYLQVENKSGGGKSSKQGSKQFELETHSAFIFYLKVNFPHSVMSALFQKFISLSSQTSLKVQLTDK